MKFEDRGNARVFVLVLLESRMVHKHNGDRTRMNMGNKWEKKVGKRVKT
jgi:hypothetical protein